jgi:hypothetical protein
MTDDMGFDLKLPAVGELTFPQWQDWLARYNAILAERDTRIEKLEAALRKIKDLHHGPEDEEVVIIRDDMTYFIVCEALGETP